MLTTTVSPGTRPVIVQLKRPNRNCRLCAGGFGGGATPAKLANTPSPAEKLTIPPPTAAVVLTSGVIERKNMSFFPGLVSSQTTYTLLPKTAICAVSESPELPLRLIGAPGKVATL